jgi:hypothetical protein
MELPKNEATFSVDVIGEITGKRYDGAFTVRCVLNMGQKHALELEKSRLVGNSSMPSDTLIGIAVILSGLRSKVIDGPEWWRQSAGGSNIIDDNVLLEVFEKTVNAEAEWKKAVKEKADSQTSTNKTSQSST